MKPKVTVLILNWNGEAMLSRFLPSVIASVAPGEAEIVVADNGSSDGSLALLRDRFPGVGVIALDGNYGFAGGYNRAIDRVDTPLCVLLNSDAEPAPGWLAPLVAEMERDPECAACQPKLLSVERRGEFEYAGASGGFIDRNGYPYCRGRIFGAIEDDRGQYDSTIEVDWATGAALMVRTDIYRAAGGLDQLFFAHMEEIDLCWRLRLSGYTVKAVPASVVYHLGGGSLPADNPRKTYLNFRNNLLLLYKNLPESCRRRKLFKRRLLDTLAWARFVAKLDFGNAGAVLAAHSSFRKMKREYAAFPVPSVDLTAGRPNILVEFYLKRRKKFSEI